MICINKSIHCVNIYLIKAVVVIKFITFLCNALWCSYSMLITLPSMHICHIKRAISFKNGERGGMKFCQFFRPPYTKNGIFETPLNNKNGIFENILYNKMAFSLPLYNKMTFLRPLYNKMVFSRPPIQTSK